ncbi:beta-1,3-galactosyltransferase 1-like [Garra rufa]|uniref:beta-1,3-galactosyltransferase 1-like n=1 Tax=Garra rufa TaxID=137080 RepID=UPI003CCEA95F
MFLSFSRPLSVIQAVIRNLFHSLAQERGPYMRHIKRTFIVLLTVALLLYSVAYVSDFNFKTFTFPQAWLNKVINQINYTTINSTLAVHTPNDSLQIQQRGTTVAQTTDIPVYYHVAHPSNYHFILDEPDKCKQNPFLVLMVPVAPHQVDARNAIRRTWGNESSVQGKTLLTLFLVGLTGGPEAQQQLEEESRQHRDLVQSNFVDSFNLTIKTMVIMDWLATRCPQANYSMKVDSDMYLNLENLMSLLLAPNTPRQNYITGMVMWDRPVIRDKSSKWYVSEELYPELKYPTYLLGMGYVFSNDLSKKLVEASKVIKPFNIEDAYVGACLKQLGVEPSSPPDPSKFKAYLGQYIREDFFRVITTILGSPQQLIDIWKDVKRPT